MKIIRILMMLLSLFGLQQADAQGNRSRARQSRKNIKTNLQNNKEMTFNYGQHTYTMRGTLSIESYDQQATGEVTFTHVPADFAEFEAVYKQFLGKTPHGTAAMMPMAMELYGRDRELGLQCLELICYPSDGSRVASVLDTSSKASSKSPDKAP